MNTKKVEFMVEKSWDSATCKTWKRHCVYSSQEDAEWMAMYLRLVKNVSARVMEVRPTDE